MEEIKLQLVIESNPLFSLNPQNPQSTVIFWYNLKLIVLLPRKLTL